MPPADATSNRSRSSIRSWPIPAPRRSCSNAGSSTPAAPSPTNTRTSWVRGVQANAPTMFSTVNRQIADFIRVRRVLAGVSEETFARALGMSYAAFERFNDGDDRYTVWQNPDCRRASGRATDDPTMDTDPRVAAGFDRRYDDRQAAPGTDLAERAAPRYPQPAAWGCAPVHEHSHRPERGGSEARSSGRAGYGPPLTQGRRPGASPRRRERAGAC